MSAAVATGKVPFPVDKAAWHPSLLPGQIVLVSTVDAGGEPNVAPKSWITMVAFEPPVLAFGCNVDHATYRNAVETGAIVVNVVPAGLAPLVWRLIEHHGAERLARSGLTLLPAEAVAPPLVGECRAHLECELDDVKLYGEEALLFGRIVGATIDEACTYERLAPVFYLEPGTFARLGPVSHVGAPV